MVLRAAGTVEPEDERGLTEPSFRGILLGGLPGFLREGFVPLAAFYGGWRLSGTGAGIAAATAASLLVYVHERRAGRDGLLVRISLAFVAVQTIVGLLSQSATVYLATPVLANAIWGVAFLGSAALRRPLAGALACAWYPFPAEFRKTPKFKHVYGVESIVWGLYLLARSALRLTVLLVGTVGIFVVVAFLTGTPAILALVAWSIWYAIRRLSDDDGAAGGAGADREGAEIGEGTPARALTTADHG
jgi:Protein of unknown function (DUF3159)